MATQYFASIFQSHGTCHPSLILEGVNPCINQEINDNLDKDFNGDEVMAALKSMCPLKASGEDGMGAVFYQRVYSVRSGYRFLLRQSQTDPSPIGLHIQSGHSDSHAINRYMKEKLKHSPPNGWIKINVDVYCCPSRIKAFSRSVIRDDHGQVMGASVKVQNGFTSVFMTEAKAARHGLKFATELGFHREDDSSEIRSVVWDIKCLSKSFSDCRFCFTPRANNKVVHVVAANGKKFHSDVYWVEEAPLEAMSLADVDRRNLGLS
ncbi:hypothetical protein GQ457_05G018670 [Hibiscus cannabinus]